jgi:hypothetical protein
MTKEEFIEFIKDLGFCSDSNNNYFLLTDLRVMNHTVFPDLLNITLNDEYAIAQLSLSHMDPKRTPGGKNFGNFSLKTFGDENDLQLELFISFIRSSFNKLPDSITKYIRDKKIKNILK